MLSGMMDIDPMLTLLIIAGLLLIIVAFATEPPIELSCPICRTKHTGDEAVEDLEDCLYSHLGGPPPRPQSAL